mmetsp:Transcript_19307/g.48061  ORF Transcript_19307/g.48061 Transcript_19307/m.48061 type:complete len:222 (-) Transcript_19307:929-1594(-)
MVKLIASIGSWIGECNFSISNLFLFQYTPAVGRKLLERFAQASRDDTLELLDQFTIVTKAGKQFFAPLNDCLVQIQRVSDVSHLDKCVLLLFVFVSCTGSAVALAKLGNVQFGIRVGVSQDCFETPSSLTSESSNPGTGVHLNATQCRRHVVCIGIEGILCVTVVVTVSLALEFSELRSFVHERFTIYGSTTAADNVSVFSIQNKVGLFGVSARCALFEFF